MSTLDQPASAPISPTSSDRTQSMDLLAIARTMASLRLTVALFGAAIFIVFYGTLAQVEKDMWEVIEDYFRSTFAWIEIRLLFPPSFFPPTNALFEWIQGLPASVGFYFPGGWLIGILLATNLLAAHLFRFKLQARGTRLVFGVIVFAIGIGFTWLICGGVQRGRGIQGIPILDPSTLWKVVQVLLVVGWVASLVKLIQLKTPFTTIWYGLLSICILMGGIVLYCLIGGAAIRPADPSLRILWQLIQATLAGAIFLVAAIMLFRKRGGIAVIHLGVALLMFGELLVGLFAVEEQIHIPEGQTVNFARDLREIELAIVDSSDPNEDRVTVVPGSFLKPGATIQHEDMPFGLKVVKRFDNADLVVPDNVDSNLATAGTGLQVVAQKARESSGADTSGAVNMASVYATVIPNRSGDCPEETYLFCQQFGDGELAAGKDRPESIRVGDKTYHVSLRFQRSYKPYSIRLLDIVKDDYQGTDTPRDYSSYVHLVDPSNNFDDDELRIWMNNPLRYNGETFYQSNYSPPAAGRPETTTLSVVTNVGWMIPYVACMVAFVGMGYHFGQNLVRFLNRTDRKRTVVTDDATDGQMADNASLGTVPTKQTSKPKKRPSHSTGVGTAGQSRWWNSSYVVPVAMLGLVVLYAASKARPERPTTEGIDLVQFGKTPVIFEGRAKPIDTLARNALQRVSNKQVLIDPDEKKHPATLWLLDVMTQSPAAEDHRVFRIENDDVRKRLGLKRRKGMRYALAEFRDKVFDGFAYTENFIDDIQRVREAAAKDVTRLSTYQRKLLEFDGRLSQYRRLFDSFVPLPFPPTPSAEEREKNPAEAEKTFQRIRELLFAVPKMDQFLKEKEPPLLVPRLADDEVDDDLLTADRWQSYAGAVNRAYVSRLLLEKEIDPGVLAWTEIVDAYVNRTPAEFNDAVLAYQEALAAAKFEDLDSRKISFEAFFNRFSPFSSAIAFYIVALLLTVTSWLFSSRTLNRCAWWLIVGTLVLHTFALGARIYISGRPPVTNLYSSAVFIGWACVLLGLFFERMFPMGIGSLVSSVSGFTTLIIAHFLAARGDTFTVLQAVLDTQFWLATHVVCIALGYSATFVAGLLGIVSVFTHAFGHSDTIIDSLTGEPQKRAVGASDKKQSETIGAVLTRMIYGTLCFALFLSFIGTVLGGLWADDSWGRFWGWDPKENGALIIVLWNALILHARWGRMIGDRGLALLAVLGNVTTGWSWFGVNELGLGLHSYGFTEGVVFYLALFAVSQLIIAGMGFFSKNWLPKSA